MIGRGRARGLLRLGVTLGALLVAQPAAAAPASADGVVIVAASGGDARTPGARSVADLPSVRALRGRAYLFARAEPCASPARAEEPARSRGAARRILWRFARGLMIAGAAIGPAPPPPPLPEPDPTEQVAEAGGEGEDED